MKRTFRTKWWALIGLAFGLFVSPQPFSAAFAAASPTEQLQALNDLSKRSGVPLEPPLEAVALAFSALGTPESYDAAARAKLFSNDGIAQWNSELSDFLSLADLLFAEAVASPSARAQYRRSRDIVVELQASVAAFVLAIHPGFAALDADSLRLEGVGAPIGVAVFDSFDKDLLLRQQREHPQIENLQSFGNPVALNHGNTVIDIILALAPEAHIIPVAADPSQSAAALEFIRANDLVAIVNVSRALLEASDQKGLDPSFAKAFKRLIRSKIVCKALGNTGTDLDGNVTPRRREAGLGPSQSLTSYDLELIRDLYEGAEDSDDLLLFGLNLTVFSDAAAWSATVPGSHPQISLRTLGVPAEGIWSPSTGTFESGSSFAAPQLAALSALLLSAGRSDDEGASPLALKKKVVRALKRSADPKGHDSSEWGLGLPSGKRASGLMRDSLP